ncbi:MAG: zinc ribbon domain-containing protein [Lachnospiraceae bacterium]|nr:zinc ribbon domain-containing protein [Lachnospiraceae bacterium]
MEPEEKKKQKIWIWAPAISLIIASAILIELRDKIYDWQSFLAALLVPVGGPLALIWLFWFWWYGTNYKKYKNWDGVVEKKEIKEYDEEKRDGSGNKYLEHSTFYRLYFRDDKGKEHTLVERDTPSRYDFFEEGERVRYHGRYTNYYEKYDKSGLDKIPCLGCGAGLDPRQNYCSRCGCIVLKGN